MSAAIDYSERRIEAGVIHARQFLQLRRVRVLVPTICRVRHGEKLLRYGGRSMRAGPGQLVLMPAGSEMDIANYPDARGYAADAVALPPQLLDEFRLRHGAGPGRMARTPPASLCVPLDTHTAAAWDSLLACLAANAPQALQHHYAQGVLLALGGHAAPLLSDRRDPLSARVQQLLMTEPDAGWTVPGVAARLHMGASTLRRQLTQEGASFRTILDDVRLGVALRCLQGTDWPIGEIAAASGYASASRFALRFRQRYGLSPRALRATL